MAIIKRRNSDNSITYQVKLRDEAGSWFPTTSHKTLEDARTEEARLFALKKKGARALSEDAKVVTVDEYWQTWSIENRRDVSAGWKITQDQMYRDYVRPILGDLKMFEVKAPHIGRVLNEAKEKGLGSQTQLHIYTLMNSMFRDAVSYYEMIVNCPVKAEFHRPKVRAQKRDFLMPQEAFRLLEYSRDHYLGPAIWLQLLAALRVSETIALEEKSIQYDLSQILICQIWNQKTKTIQPYPKQLDWAYVPIPPMLKTYLQSLNRRPDDFIAQGINGGRLSYNTFLGALRRVCKAAGVREITPHELRHSSTEIYMQAGASAEDIRRLLNHSSFTATKNYIHRTDERLNFIAESIGPNTVFPKKFPNGNKQAYIDADQEIGNVH